ncbi:hypothetical protein [Kiloniella sp.]|uniref:hypothetical protein n=1 Tax=Kiloniella sp. TaxID=1938587 RepID=UPI003B01F43A
MTQEMATADLPIDIRSKPTKRLRLILGLYSGFVGLISTFLIPIGWYYYTFGYLELLDLELNLQKAAFASINIVFSYILLPRFMSQDRYNPGKAILGGIITFVIAQFIRSLIAGYLMSDLEIFSQPIIYLSLFIENLLPLFTISMVIAVLLGGFSAWFINKLLFSNPAYIGSTNTSLWTETLSTKLIKTYNPSRLNPNRTTQKFRLITASYCGAIGLIIPAILTLIYLIAEGRSFDLERDLEIEMFILVPGCLFFGFTLIPRYLNYSEYKPKRSFGGGMLALGLTSFITIISYALYTVPNEKIKSWMTSELTLFLSINLPTATFLVLVGSLIGGLIIWPGYRLLFIRRMTNHPQPWSVFD